MPDIGDLDQWEAEFDRRSIGRTRITKGALLFFKGQPGTRGALTSIGRLLNFEIFDPLTRTQLRDQPARLLATAGPSF
jgi:hypothetical protein